MAPIDAEVKKPSETLRQNVPPSAVFHTPPTQAPK